VLKQNGYRDNFGGLRFFGGGILVNGAYTQVSQGYTGAARNLWAGEAGIDPKSSVPAGARHPVAWRMASTAGGLASRNQAKVTVSQTALAVLGLPAAGSTTITLDVTDATGSLIVSGSGSATIDFSVTGTILSVASASGTAEITFTPTGLIGAQAGISGSASATLTPTANISAIGYMSGLSTNETEFSAAALANAVWTASAAAYNETGTMGEKLNDAGSGSNPWTEIIESGLSAAEILRIILSVQAGKTDITGSTVTFRDVADTKDRVTATMTGSERTSITIDGS